MEERKQGDIGHKRDGCRCDNCSGKIRKRLESAARQPGLAGIEHVPVDLREPYEKSEEWQTRCKRSLEVAHIEDAAVQMNVRVIGIDGVDAAGNLDMVPGVKQAAEKRDGGKPSDPAPVISVLDDAEIHLLHLRHGSEKPSRRYPHDERSKVDRVRKQPEILACEHTEAAACGARTVEPVVCNPYFAQKHGEIEQSLLPRRNVFPDQLPDLSSSTGSTDENSLIALLKVSRSPSE